MMENAASIFFFAHLIPSISLLWEFQNLDQSKIHNSIEIGKIG